MKQIVKSFHSDTLKFYIRTCGGKMKNSSARVAPSWSSAASVRRKGGGGGADTLFCTRGGWEWNTENRKKKIREKIRSVYTFSYTHISNGYFYLSVKLFPHAWKMFNYFCVPYREEWKAAVWGTRDWRWRMQHLYIADISFGKNVSERSEAVERNKPACAPPVTVRRRPLRTSNDIIYLCSQRMNERLSWTRYKTVIPKLAIVDDTRWKRIL